MRTNRSKSEKNLFCLGENLFYKIQSTSFEGLICVAARKLLFFKLFKTDFVQKQSFQIPAPSGNSCSFHAFSGLKIHEQPLTPRRHTPRGDKSYFLTLSNLVYNQLRNKYFQIIKHTSTSGDLQ